MGYADTVRRDLARYRQILAGDLGQKARRMISNLVARAEAELAMLELQERERHNADPSAA